jgi:hypothetical protein
LESAAYASICEHLQKPHNAGSQREARFFNTLIEASGNYMRFGGTGQGPLCFAAQTSCRFTPVVPATIFASIPARLIVS